MEVYTQASGERSNIKLIRFFCSAFRQDNCNTGTFFCIDIL